MIFVGGLIGLLVISCAYLWHWRICETDRARLAERELADVTRSRDAWREQANRWREHSWDQWAHCHLHHGGAAPPERRN